MKTRRQSGLLAVGIKGGYFVGKALSLVLSGKGERLELKKLSKQE